MPTKLNQIVAVSKGLQSRTMAAVNLIDNTFNRTMLFSGFSKTYTAKFDGGDVFPKEETLVQKDAEGELKKVTDLLAQLYDVVYTKDAANTETSASVVVDGVSLATDVPVSFLLFLGKELDNMRKRLARLPVQSQDELWFPVDGVANMFRTEAVDSFKTKKVRKVVTKAPATERHQADTEIFNDDEIIGTWKTTKYTSAVTQDRKDELIARVDKLTDAVKAAVEEANSYEITQLKIGKTLLDWLLA